MVFQLELNVCLSLKDTRLRISEGFPEEEAEDKKMAEILVVWCYSFLTSRRENSVFSLVFNWNYDI